MSPERTGEVIGGVIALLIFFGPLAYLLYITLQDATWQRRFLRLLDRGDRVRARKLLDRRAKQRKQGKKIRRKRNLLLQRARLLGLWMLGELDELRAALARHKGGAAYVANVEMFGLLALATEPGDQTGIAVLLEDLAGKVTADSIRLSKPARELADLLARIGAGLEGRGVAEIHARTALARHHIERHLTKVLLLRVLIVGAERFGKPSNRLQAMLAGLTRRFAYEPAPIVAA
jgi:hypothetical protein